MFRAFLVTTPDMGSDAHRGVDVAFADGVTTVYPAIKFSRNHQLERGGERRRGNCANRSGNLGRNTFTSWTQRPTVPISIGVLI
jgi:hypothetical protein